MKLDRFLSGEGSTVLALSMPDSLKQLNPEVISVEEKSMEEDFDLEFYHEDELVGMADYDIENEIFQLMTVEPTEWHSKEDRDFVDMLCSTLAAPAVTWYSGFSDGSIASIYCMEEGYSMVAFRIENGVYEADFMADPSALEDLPDEDSDWGDSGNRPEDNSPSDHSATWIDGLEFEDEKNEKNPREDSDSRDAA
ncbi:MAG: hypothetical protein KDK25_13285 [Leptospiraceae bacterium]|nr:hypothetical protein [Leptospiraceae bacterium]